MASALPIPEIPPFAAPGGPFAEQIFTRIGTTVDEALLRAVGLVVERALIPDAEDVEGLRRSAEGMLAPALQRDPGRFFDFARETALPLGVATRTRRRIAGGRVLVRKLTTEYRPWGLHGAPASRLSNADPILLEHWVHDRPARGTVLALHGFTMGRPAIDRIALFASQWFDEGLDVALMTLPHHGARTPAEARFSGEWFAVPDVARLSEAVREAIYEIGVARRWLADSTDGPVGLLGLSLGGYLTALMAGLEEDLDFAIPMVPPVCMGDLAWRFFERTSHHRSGHPAALSHDELRAAFRVHSPLAHPLRTPAERVLIVAGRGDRVVPPEHPHALWQHWGRPAIHWFGGSHLAPFGRGRIVEAVVLHLRGLGIL